MTNPFKAREIHLADGSVLHGVVCQQVDGFLIVGKDDQDDAPVWYSAAAVVKMIGVQVQKPTRTQRPQKTSWDRAVWL